MNKLEPTAAVAVIGFATFELIKLWNDSTPSLKESRNAGRDDVAIRQQVFDADVLVGTLSVIIGVAYAVLTKDMTALIILLVMFGALSFYHHYLLNAEPTR